MADELRSIMLEMEQIGYGLFVKQETFSQLGELAWDLQHRDHSGDSEIVGMMNMLRAAVQNWYWQVAQHQAAMALDAYIRANFDRLYAEGKFELQAWGLGIMAGEVVLPAIAPLGPTVSQTVSWAGSLVKVGAVKTLQAVRYIRRYVVGPLTGPQNLIPGIHFGREAVKIMLHGHPGHLSWLHAQFEIAGRIFRIFF
jgi:hypothetical protein